MKSNPNMHSWLDRNGVFHPVTGTHTSWLHRQRLSIEDAVRQGYARVLYVGNTIYAELPQPLNHYQKQALINLASETGMAQVVWDTGEHERAIWLRQSESMAAAVVSLLLEDDNLTPEEFMGFVKGQWIQEPQHPLHLHVDKDGTMHRTAPFQFSQGGKVFGPQNSIKLRTHLTAEQAQKWCDYFNFIQSRMPYSPVLYGSLDAWIDTANTSGVYNEWRASTASQTESTQESEVEPSDLLHSSGILTYKTKASKVIPGDDVYEMTAGHYIGTVYDSLGGWSALPPLTNKQKVQRFPTKNEACLYLVKMFQLWDEERMRPQR